MKEIRVHVQLRAALHYWKGGSGTIAHPEACQPPLQLIIPYTTPRPAKAALDTASVLASSLGAEILLLAVREVPFPLPLDGPAFQPEHFLSQLTALAEGISCPVRIHLVLTRSKSESLRQLIPPASMVVLATEKHWRKTEEQRLARYLERAGCTVSLLPVTGNVRGPLAAETPASASSDPPRAETLKVNHA